MRDIRKVFLDDLPRWGKGESKVNWRLSVGESVAFVWDEIEGFIHILDYNTESRERYLIVRYLNEKFKIRVGDFSRCKIGKMINNITGEFKINIGETFVDAKRNILILDRKKKSFERKIGEKKYIQSDKHYKYKCNKCGYEGWMLESGIITRGSGCSCCSSNVAVLGINTIWDTDRWVCDLGVSEEDAKRYSKFSSKKVIVKCPDCKKEKKIVINSIIINKSIRCDCCKTGFSYPERFLYSLLCQLDLKFKTQMTKNTFKWCGNYRYDFYLPDYNTIIEVHGKQHYEKNTTFKLSLEEEQQNDEIKKNIALKNGIENYIVIDCRRSDFCWVKSNIIKSRLSNLCDLSNIDWLKCEESALSNLVKEVCEYWNSKEYSETMEDIAQAFHISNTTVRKYLRAGNKIGWCEYIPKEEVKKGGLKLGERNRIRCSKRTEVLRNGESLGVFESTVELSKYSESVFGIKISGSAISNVCSGKRKSHKGFTFKYIND